MTVTSESAGNNPEKAPQSRIGIYVGVAILALVIALVAFFQEEIGYTVNLEIWNQRAPAQIVEQFLTAAQQGEEQQATSYLQMAGTTPLVKSGKWLGYVVPQGMISTEIRTEDLLPPEGKPLATHVSYVFKGPGQARVKVPGRGGKEVEYRLERPAGEWKITDVQAQREHK